jgi:hypothetical protein
MAGMSQQIFAGAGITGNQQRRAQRSQRACSTTWRIFGLTAIIWLKRPDPVRGFAAASHSDGGTQHHHRAGQNRFADSPSRWTGDFHQEICPLITHVR